MGDLVYPLRAGSEKSAELMGGKGANLIHLIEAGFSVPGGCVLTTKLFSTHYKKKPFNKKTDTQNGSSQYSESENITIDKHLKKLLGMALSEFPAQTAFAVRSSGSDEDAGDTSFAGQHDTILNVVGLDSIVKAVRACWASIDTEAACVYRQNHGVEDNPQMAVVIQQMIPAHCAGVMFTRHPVRPDLDRIVVEGVSGLGEALVSGEVTPDRIEIERSGQIAVSEINSADGKMCLDRVTDVDFVVLAEQLESYFKKPQDVEWAYDGDTFWFLQTRPITTLKRPQEVWTRIWGDEFWAEATTPMQYTCLGRWIREDYFAAVRKISGFDHLMKGEPFERIHSHIYFNAGYMYQFMPLIDPVLRIPRFFNWLPPYWLSEIADLPYKKSLVMFGQLKARLLDKNANIFTHHKKLNAYIESVEQALHHKLNDNLANLDDDQLWQRLLETDRLGQQHFQFIRWGMGSYLFPLKLMTIRRGMDWAGDTSGHDTEMLLTAESDNRTVEVNKELKKLGEIAAEVPLLKKLLLDSETPVTLDQVKQLPDTSFFCKELDFFLKVHGHRGTTRELHMPRWMDDPSLVLGLVTAYVHAPSTLECELDNEAESKRVEIWLDKIKASHVLWGGIRKWIAGHLLSLARAYIAYRENQRYALDYILTDMRHVMIEMGTRLVKRGYIKEADDIFFLTFDELKKVLGSIEQKVRFECQHIDSRKMEFKKDAQQLPADWIIDGVEYGADKNAQIGDNVFKGTGASSGQFTGPARVITSPHELGRVRKGDILVAPNTDPGWTPVFPLIKGLVLETGGMLSHGAIVAREYAIPAVTGVVGVCRVIENGMIISVDGNTGKVQIVEPSEAQMAG